MLERQPAAGEDSREATGLDPVGQRMARDRGAGIDAAVLDARALVRLQRSAGNAAVSRLLSTVPPLQTTAPAAPGTARGGAARRGPAGRRLLQRDDEPAPPAGRSGVLDNGRVTAATRVTFGRRQVTLPPGTYVEVLSATGATLRVRVWSGFRGRECDLPRDRFHHNPQLLGGPLTNGDQPSDRRPDETLGYARIPGVLIAPSGPSAADVRQGALGDCWLAAAMVAVAQTQPALIRGLFTPQGDRMIVHLWTRAPRTGLQALGSRRLIRRDVVVDVQSLPGGGYVTHLPARVGPGHAATDQLQFAGLGLRGMGRNPTAPDARGRYRGHPLWPMVIEQAYAELRGGYDDIHDSERGRFALEAITGRIAHENEDPELEALRAALGGGDANPLHQPPAMMLTTLAGYGATGRAVFLGTRDGDHRLNVHGNHSYTIEGVDVAGDRVRLRNPWARDHPRPMTAADVQRVFQFITIGEARPSTPAAPRR